jgi:hypothetical protein
MSKRQSAESRIITYFEQAPLASVAIVLGIVKEKVRMRQLADVGVNVVPARRKAKGKRNARITAAPGTQTAFDPGSMGEVAQ